MPRGQKERKIAKKLKKYPIFPKWNRTKTTEKIDAKIAIFP